MSAKPKILFLDIETSPAVAYTWGLHNVNISLAQLIEPSAPICVSAKWYGDKSVSFFADWIDGHENFIRSIYDMICEADAVVTYNGDSFDLKKLQGEFLLQGLPPPPPWTSIDLLKTVKKLGYQSNKLGYVGPLLELGKKVEHEGFDLWVKVRDGDFAAQKKMQKYCIQDTLLLEELYIKVLPYIPNHPTMGEAGVDQCGACGSYSLQKRGFRRTKAFKIQRLQCQKCGSWSDGTRSKV